MCMIKMNEITKTYPNVTALDRVSVEFREQEIHALLGENGAGKSTLMKVLYGMTIPDQGTIEIDGQQIQMKNPMQAIGMGIGMVHQHFMLAEAMTVLENIIAGSEPKHGSRIDYKKAAEQVTEMIGKFRFSIDPEAYISELTVGEKQQVEILKVLYRSAETLILDEPTAVLSPNEVEGLFRVLRELKAQGKSCIIITHKLYEVIEIADRVTVMRDGAVTGRVDPEELAGISTTRLAEYMVGREIKMEHQSRRDRLGEVLFRVNNLTYRKKDRTILDDISFYIRRGEILGIAGVEGNGQSEMIKALTGMLVPDSMELFLDEEPVEGDTRKFLDLGIGHIPEDRLKYAVAKDMSIAENITLGYQNREPFSRKWRMDLKKMKEKSEAAIKKYAIKAADSEVLVSQLSGGNQQKVVIARVFEQAPKVMVCAQLTRGVDIGSSEFFYSQIRKYRDQGNAVLLISSDLQEVLTLSDTVAVMFKGHIADIRPAEEFTQKDLGILMTGGSIARGGAADEENISE